MSNPEASISRDDALAQARAIAPILEAGASRAEEERALPGETVAAMKKAEVFRLFQPHEVGGYEADFETQIVVAEELARASGSAGWNSIANGPSEAVLLARSKGLGDAIVSQVGSREAAGGAIRD